MVHPEVVGSGGHAACRYDCADNCGMLRCGQRVIKTVGRRAERLRSVYGAFRNWPRGDMGVQYVHERTF